VRVIHVLRKPLVGSVATNVLEHGTGAINIDACRINSGEQPSPTKAPGWDSYNKSNAEQGYRPTDYAQGDALYVPSESGRWPANLILEHKPGCCIIGTQTVKAKQLTAGRRTVKWGVGEGGDTYEKGTGAQFATSDGLDTAPVWECEPGCPVADLDEQSGDCRGMSRQILRRGASTGTSIGGHGIYGKSSLHEAMVGYDDTGGASRFFKQVGGKSDE